MLRTDNDIYGVTSSSNRVVVGLSRGDIRQCVCEVSRIMLVVSRPGGLITVLQNTVGYYFHPGTKLNCRQ